MQAEELSAVCRACASAFSRDEVCGINVATTSSAQLADIAARVGEIGPRSDQIGPLIAELRPRATTAEAGAGAGGRSAGGSGGPAMAVAEGSREPGSAVPSLRHAEAAGPASFGNILICFIFLGSNCFEFIFQDG